MGTVEEPAAGGLLDGVAGKGYFVAIAKPSSLFAVIAYLFVYVVATFTGPVIFPANFSTE